MTATAEPRQAHPEPTIRHRLDDLIANVRQGRLADSILAFYGENVRMQENLAEPTVGRQANVERERAFEQSIASWNAVQANAVLVDGDQAVIHWVMDYNSSDGKRYRLDQLSLQRWKDGVIVEERFFYDPATVAAG